MSNKLKTATQDPEEVERRRRNREDVAMPLELTADGREAWRVIKKFLTNRRRTYTGGCKAFFEPKDWERREKHDYGTEGVVLVVVYDGGELAWVFNPAYEDRKAQDGMRKALAEAGFFVEPIAHWWSNIRKNT